MRYPNAAKDINKIFIAEILSITAAVPVIVTVVPVAASPVGTSTAGEETLQARLMQ